MPAGAAAAGVGATMTDLRWDAAPTPGPDRSEARTAKLPPLPASPPPRATAAGTGPAGPGGAPADAPSAAPRTAPDPAAPRPRAGAGPTRAAAGRPARAPIKKPGPFPVIAGSLGLFLATAAGLAFQMRAGADPALGGEPVVLAAGPRPVIERRVVITRIVEHRPRGGAAPTAAPAVSEPAAPAPAAATPAPAPAGTPAPAPLTTRSS